MKRFIIIILFGCLFFGKAIAQPTVVMQSITNVSYYGAKLNAKLTGGFGSWTNTSGAGTVNGVGFIYDTIPMPVMRTGIQYKQVSTTSPMDSIFTFDINTNTTPSLFMRSGKTYYVRAFAKKSIGGNDTVWSAPMSVYIPYPTSPTLVMKPTTNIEMFNATLNAEFDTNDIATIQGRGFVHSSVTPMPTIQTGTRANVSGAIDTCPITYSYNLNNLTSDLTYYARAFVIFKYKNIFSNDTLYSDPINFKTHDACYALPSDVKIDSVDITTAIVSFIPAPFQTQWEVEYDFPGHTPGTGTSVITTNDTVLLVGLTGGTSYSVFVRAICSNSFSEWTEIKTFITRPPLCAPIYNLSGSNYTHSSAKITWMPGSATQNRWEVRFGLFSQPLPNSGAIVEGDPIFVLVGLTPFTEYKVQVRALCGLYDSDWSEPYSFITLRQGLDDVKDVASKVEIFPNPTNGTIYFKDEKKQDVSKIEIWSSLGELIYKSDYLPETLTLDNYSKGLYLVKIYKEDKVQIEKIILN
ncbi:MAG TPA: hypothetical protein DD434_05635 [Bacteroidales bacterium]|nr:hypothetical protein [Bacteroidales bacterium]